MENISKPLACELFWVVDDVPPVVQAFASIMRFNPHGQRYHWIEVIHGKEPARTPVFANAFVVDI